MTVYYFFNACSQTDAHFDPDTADNAKQQNHTHHKTIPLVFRFTFGGFSQICDCCRFRSMDFAFKVSP